jgi:glycosyltransferase involved in cell wall biosynthesis
MRILVLTKRQYMAKDILDDRFGRFWELPLELARRGHEVQGIALSYRSRPQGSFTFETDAPNGKVNWHAMNLLDRGWPALRGYIRRAIKISTDFRPEIFWACSDAYHAIFGRKLADHFGSNCVIDLYDNFESYGATKIPGVLPLFKHAVTTAAGVTCVSSRLATHIRDDYRCRAPILVLENAIRDNLFYPRDTVACRKQLGLPTDGKFIGTAGALHPNRGIDTLYRGYEILAREDHQLHLAVAGPRPNRHQLPISARIHDLGTLPFEVVPVFFNALDVAVVCNRDSFFGRYNFPQKTREIIACGIPLVATAVGSSQDLLREHPECLFAPDDPASLARAIRAQLVEPKRIDRKVPSWSALAAQLETFLLEILNRRP